MELVEIDREVNTEEEQGRHGKELKGYKYCSSLVSFSLAFHSVFCFYFRGNVFRVSCVQSGLSPLPRLKYILSHHFKEDHT